MFGIGHGCDVGYDPGDPGGSPGAGGPVPGDDVSLSSQALIDPGTILVDTVTDVGTAPGNFSVGHDGSANYVVPLWTPDAVAVQPNLALRYSSTAGEGRLGYGWDITGLSEITRCPAGKHIQEQKTSVEFGPQDLLCLDGVRLNYIFAESGGAGPGTNGAVYYTEPDQQTRVKVVGSDSLGPASFEVRTRDGLIHTYGNHQSVPGGVAQAKLMKRIPDQNGVIQLSFPDVRYAWQLTNTRDRFNNQLTIYYWPRLPGVCATSLNACSNLGQACPGGEGLCSPGICAVTGATCPTLGASCSGGGICEPYPHEPQALPKQITYGPTSQRHVVFYYTDRLPQAMRTIKAAELNFRNKWRTFWVEMWAPNPATGNTIGLFRGYYIDTFPVSGAHHQMVKSIKECDGDAKYGIPPGTICKKATEFTYETGTKGYQLLPVGSNPVNDIRGSTSPEFWRMMVADLNNDGRDDILYRVGRTWKYSLSKCQGNLTGCGYDKGVSLNISGDLAGSSGADPFDVVISDWNLDGVPDLAGIKPGDPTLYTYWKGTSVGNFTQDFTDLDFVGSGRRTSAVVIAGTGKGRPNFFRPLNGGTWAFRTGYGGGWGDIGSEPVQPGWDDPDPTVAWNTLHGRCRRRWLARLPREGSGGHQWWVPGSLQEQLLPLDSPPPAVLRAGRHHETVHLCRSEWRWTGRCHPACQQRRQSDHFHESRRRLCPGRDPGASQRGQHHALIGNDLERPHRFGSSRLRS